MKRTLPKVQNNRSVKFLQSISRETYTRLQSLAVKKDATIQDYIRIIIIPQYLESLPVPVKKYSKRAKKAWATRRKNKREAIPEVPTAPRLATDMHGRDL